MKRFLSFFFLLSLLFVGCGSSPKPEKQVLRINFPTDPLTLDPRKGSDVTSSIFHFMLFEGLTRLTPHSTHDFGMAESIDISQDGKTYTFCLRDAYWSDGTPVTAEDFAYAWRTMLSPDFVCPNVNLLYPVKNAEKVKMGSLPLSSLGLETPDSKTFVVRLENPTPYFLELTAFCVLAPVPSHIAKENPKWADDLNKDFVTNGPFQLESWRRMDQLVVTKNSYYWEKEKITLDKVRISVIENQNTALQLFEKKELDMLGGCYTSIPIEVMERLSKTEYVKNVPIAATAFCSFNLEKFPFSNEHIRKAFAYAINRDELVQHIACIDEQVGTHLIPSVLLNEDPSPCFEDHAVSLAQEHLEIGLKETGLSKKDLSNLVFLYRNFDTNQKIAQVLQQQWKKVLGFTVKLENCETKVFLDRLQVRDYDFACSYLRAQYNDEMNILERFKNPKNPKNYPGWHSREYAELLAKACSEKEEKNRKLLMRQAENLLLEEMPLTPLYHASSCYLFQPWVKNLYFSPTGSLFLQGLTVDLDYE